MAIRDWFRKKSAEAPPSVALVQRADSWQNTLTGVGDPNRDKTIQGYFFAPDRLDDQQLLAMYNGSDLVAKAVEKPYKEMLRRGYELSADDVDPDEISDLQKAALKLRANDLFTTAGIFGSLFGGGILILGADDGQTPDKPLQEDRIKSFKFLSWVDRRFVIVSQNYNNMLAPSYGQPELYTVTNSVSGNGVAVAGPVPATAIIHESRVIRFDGAVTDVLTSQQLAGWTFSTLQRPYETLRKFEHAFDAVGYLMSDASQAVFKLQGLINMIAAGQTSVVQARMMLMDMSRSTARMVVIDSETEELKREATSFAGLPDLLDRWMMRLAAAFDQPVTELFGRAASGLNATGDNDTRKWYDLLASRQENELAPKLKRFYQLLASAWDSPVSNKDAEFEIKFRPLWQPTDKEQAEYQLAVAQTDNLYLTQGVVTPEQVALGRWGSGTFSSWIDVDTDALQKSIDTQKAFDPYAKDPIASAQGAAVAAGTAGPDGKPLPPPPPAPPGAKPPVPPPGK